MSILKNLIVSLTALLVMPACIAAESASIDLSINIPEFMSIRPVTSPVLVANITDKTGDLFAPLYAKFRVVTNNPDRRTLYLKSNVVTQGGYEDSMYEQGGQVYIAFANLSKIPTSESLHKCKIGSAPNESPGVVAYPVTSITGGKYKFLKGKNKYEIELQEQDSTISINVGRNVNQMSFGSNDPKGFYQAVLSLTEADI